MRLPYRVSLSAPSHESLMGDISNTLEHVGFRNMTKYNVQITFWRHGTCYHARVGISKGIEIGKDGM